MGKIIRNGRTYMGGNLTHTTNEIIQDPFSPTGAGYHNSIYRGKNLGTAVTDEQWAAIKAGTFDDLFIGDYWKINDVKYYIAAFDYYYDNYADSNNMGTGSSYVDVHHITIVPDSRDLKWRHTINPGGTVTGYGTSSMRTALNDEDDAASPISVFKLAFGADNILQHGIYMNTGTLSTNSYPSRSLISDKVRLLSERNVWGHLSYGYQYWRQSITPSSTNSISHLYSMDERIYPLFLFSSIADDGNDEFNIMGWLRDPVTPGDAVSISYFAYVTSGGCSICDFPSHFDEYVVAGFEIFNP